MSDPLIRLDDVHFSYVAARPVLAGINLAIHPGERVCIDGANGSGKTTLLEVIVGLHKPTGGRIAIGGQECRTEADFQAIRGRIGLVFQHADDQLFCPTVIDDVAFGPLNQGASRAAARALAVETLRGLELDALAERATYQLSAGEKRLVALAAVLAMKPEALLLDEPTTGLDEQAWHRLQRVLEMCAPTMLLVSHDRRLSEALATRRLRLEQGCLR